MPTTEDHAQKLDALAVALADAFRTIPDLTVYEFEPIGVALEGITVLVGSVDLERVGIDEAESELGRSDWLTTWNVTAHIPLQEAEDDQRAARALIGRMVRVIDADQGLGGEALEAKLVEARQGYNDDSGEQRRLIVIECSVEVLALMPRP